ncbi:MAG: 50S ribosomal protein L29 [Candidatus Omnitrophica bacterium]|nr:50S ribosomal protein L29 [Candidatus Omnitrophota bacterium]MBU1932333.1 50S ribosomal protein L29 [Candidatus Omnitrophota bacterium]
MLKLSELRNLSRQELNEKVTALKKFLFETRSQGASGRIEKPSKIRETRRDIARILTILREKKEK